MNNQPRVALIGENIIGNVSSYPALPAVQCPSCGTKLHRIYNTQTSWQYVCMSEKLLVAPGTEDPPVKVQVE